MPKCRCGAEADFRFSKGKTKEDPTEIPPEDFCRECFQMRYPQYMEQEIEAQHAALLYQSEDKAKLH